MRFVKRLFIFFIVGAMFLASNSSALAAGQCGVDTYQDGSGSVWTTGCYLVNVGGTKVPESGWDCAVGFQCFQVERYTPGNINIKWTPLNNASSPYHGKPALCIGGFSSRAALENHKVELACTSNCGGVIGRIYNGLTGQSSQTVDLAGSPIGQAKDGTYYTCFSGDLDGTARAVIEDNYRDKNLSCVVIGGTAAVVVGVATSVFATITVPIIVGTSAAGGIGINACLKTDITNFPTVQAAVVDKSNNARIAVTTAEIKVDLTAQDQAAVDPGKLGGNLINTDICTFAGAKKSECTSCVLGNPPGIWTAVGCIPASPQDFVTKLLQLAIGIAGGIAFLMILYGGFTMMLSSGNPEKLNSGKEIVTSAIAGLLLIIFSVVILRIIGVDVLGIPGLQ